jgi:hypothetical protein
MILSGLQIRKNTIKYNNREVQIITHYFVLSTHIRRNNL